jgi:hypothetical protein
MRDPNPGGSQLTSLMEAIVHGSRGPVGRKSRRAEGVAKLFCKSAPDLSRSVGVIRPRSHEYQKAGFVTIFVGWRPHGAAQIRRGCAEGVS